MYPGLSMVEGILDGGKLVVSSDILLQLTPEVIDWVEAWALRRQKQQSHTETGGQGEARFGSMRRVVIEQQKQRSLRTAAHTQAAKKSLKVILALLASSDAKPAARTQVHGAKERTLRVASADVHLGLFAYRCPRSAERREQP